MHKKYFYILFIFLVLLFLGIIFLKKPTNVKVSAYTYPYSIVSNIEEEDVVNIEILINDKNNQFTSIEEISNCYLKDKNDIINLVILDIVLLNDNIDINEETFYIYNYKCEIDFKCLSDYELYLEDCSLELDFSSSLHASIKIGSFSYYKYVENDQELGVTSLKVINKSRDNNNSFYGFEIGIRNYTNSDITLNSINILDGNIKEYKICKIDEIIDDTVENIFLNRKEEDIDDMNVNLVNNDITYFAIRLDYSSYSLDYLVSSLGLKLEYNSNKEFYLEKFLFYNTNYYPNSSNLKIYEYTNN